MSRSAHDHHISLPINVTVAVVAAIASACGEPSYENPDKRRILADDKITCSLEFQNSLAAMAPRQGAAATGLDAIQFIDHMEACLARKGWRQVRSKASSARQEGTVARETPTLLPRD